VISLASDEPMQLRAGGNLRRVIDAQAPNAPGAAFHGLHDAVAHELQILSKHPTVAEAVNTVLGVGGTGARLGDTAVTANHVGFLANDGSVSSLLRTLQPAMHLDDGGLLGLASHGTTTTAVLSSAEAMLLASVPGALTPASVQYRTRHEFGPVCSTNATTVLLLRISSLYLRRYLAGGVCRWWRVGGDERASRRSRASRRVSPVVVGGGRRVS